MGRRGHQIGSSAARSAVVAVAAVACAVLAAPAAAHVERASYFPDPGAEIVGGQEAGGAIPQIRSLFTALDASQPGDTRVVCPGGPSSVPQALPDKSSTGPTSSPGSTASAAEKKQIKKRIKKLRRKIRKAKKKGNTAKVRRLEALLAALLASSSSAGRVDNTPLYAHPSIQALQASIADAEANGYKLRPYGALITLLPGEGQALLDFNIELLKSCGFDSIQAAVNASGNNDRVVVMPGLYTEPDSRAAPTNDPACDSLKETNDHGNTGALSYKYQVSCPNDQNLIAVIGRSPNGNAPQPPALDRHGIPDEGPCIRCNLQIEGSGVKPDDVIVDAGNVGSGDAAPIDPVKDVGIRADRADGFVLRNVKVRHAAEHDVYAIETDGFNLDRLITAFGGEYGVLTFVADHSLIQNCDAFGNGDSGIYPGASADVGDAVDPPDRRFGTEIRNCDMHHNASGYSGTDGNAVWLHDNYLYDNTLGFTTDVFTAPGHPGFPQDSDSVEHNFFFSNNFNTYLPPCGPGETPGPNGPNQDCSDVASTVPVPVGTGMWIAGGNHNTIRNNYFWDNWRRGTMLFSVPDQFVCGPAGVDPSQLAGCNPTAVPPSTSYNNRYHDNVMSRDPSGNPDPNGLDFWWDEYPLNTGNCWYDNVGKDGTRASLTAEPPINPVPDLSSLPTDVPFFLPEKCATSTGVLGPAQETELISCLANFSEGAPTPCTWFETPTEPAP